MLSSTLRIGPALGKPSLLRPAGVIYIVLSIVLYLDLCAFVLSRFLSYVYCRYDPNDLNVLILHPLHLALITDTECLLR